jgi:hypothetical protein
MPDAMSDTPTPRRSWRKIIMLALVLLFFAPVALRALGFAFQDRPRSFRDADWSSVGSLPMAKDYPGARVLILAGQTGGWKGVVSLHSWVVIKDENAPSWTRYDVVGWGSPVRTNNWAPDGRWYGSNPIVVADISGAQAKAIIPRVREAITIYRFANNGDYRIWPGPNSNSFVAAVLRAVPEIGVTLPPNAIGRDFRDGFYAGTTDSGTGIELNLWGFAGFKIAAVEGLEFNFLGLVSGLDFRNLGIKLPAFGTLTFNGMPALAATPTKR